MKVKLMVLLDTDHISLIARGGAEGQRIRKRLSVLPPTEVAVSIASYEEQMRGWLAEIAAARTVDRQEPKYHELGRMLKYYCTTPILPFEGNAISMFQNLWIQRLRVGTMDLKIAAIALANDATLLTRNLADFNKVPDLRAEDWSA
jgi:tRNA(fMet)-specific endonuclease VapC